MAVLTKSFADQLIAEQGKDVVISNIYTSIADDAFSGSGLTSVVIPDSVTSIGINAFQSNQLTSVDIPDSVTSIGEKSFYSDTIESVTISENVTSLGDNAFDISTTVVNLGNGKVIGPDENQYKVLQGVLPGSKTFNEIDRGEETLGTRDIFILPKISLIHIGF